MGRHKYKYEFDFTQIGLAIKDSREASKITREAAAEMLDVSSRHLQAVELEGQHPCFDLFIQLITMFNVPVDTYIFPEHKVEKSSIRRRVDKLLDSLDDKDLMIIEATAKAIYETNALKK
ncbi:MAG: helix-turn-helix domain-containing protein [Oscillospiraceae bacterium]|nr:helix-turn-helix domain-containing protein [Oscillospiraceae bacterium]